MITYNNNEDIKHVPPAVYLDLANLTVGYAELRLQKILATI